MKYLMRQAISVGFAVLAGAGAACSSGTQAGVPGTSNGGDEQTGTVHLNLEVAPGITISTLNWTITNKTIGFSQSGNVNEQFANVIDFQIGDLPSGSGYTIALSATSTDGSLSCAGLATFTVAAGSTTPVGVVLSCSGTADSGNVAVTATTQICPSIAGISVLPLETTLNEPVSLAATVAGTAAPTFAWTATAGTFDNASSATPVFTCPGTPGAVTITLTVGPNAESCPATASQSVTVTCDTLDPTFTNVYANVIGARCTSCHAPGKSGVTAGGLDLSTAAAAYANLVNVPSAGTSAGSAGVTCASLGIDQTADAGGDGGPVLLRVVPGDSADSLIFEKVNDKLLGTNPPCGSAMPLGATNAPLTQAQVNLIASWINAGAQNN
jgi:hypothetical protein